MRSINSALPTRTDKDMYYINKERVNNKDYPWMVNNNGAVNTRRRANYARKKRELLMFAITGD